MEWASRLQGDAGAVSLYWRPDFAFDGHASDERLLDVDGDAFAVDWQGAAGHGSEAQAIALVNDGVTVARWWPQHLEGDLLRVVVHFGGATRPYLFVNGAGVLADAAWVPPTVGATVATADDVGDLRLSSSLGRRPRARVVACLGDSLSLEWYNADPERAPVGHVKSWPRFAGLHRRSSNTFFLQCGVGGDQLPGMLARAQEDVVDAGATDCLLLGGLNDVKANRTFEQMRDDVLDIADILAAGRVRARGCRVLPFAGADGVWSQPREDERLDFNAWAAAHPILRAVESDRAMGDGATPPALLAAFDISDGEHPSAAGAEKLGRYLGSLFQ